MDITELKKELLENKLRPYYVFTGNELALQDVYIDKILEISKLEKVRLDKLSKIYTRLSAKTLIKAVPKVYVIRNDEQYLKEEKIWENVVNCKNQKGNIVILLYTDIDKRGKFQKTHEPILTEFNFMGESVLRNRLQAVTGMPVQYCDDLIKICGCNYGRIKNELYNINMLAKINNYSLNTAYLEARKNNLIHEEIGDIIFDFVSAVEDRNINKAYELYHKLEKTDEGPLKLITVLYNAFRNILIVQSTNRNERTEEVLGLSAAQIFVTSKKCDKYTLTELVKIVKLLRDVEKGIKTGEVDVNYSMEFVLSQIF